MSIHDNKLLARRYFQAFNDDDRYVFADIIAPDARLRDPFPEGALGHESISQRSSMFHTAFPDLRLLVNDMLAEEDRVAVRWTAEGTHNGELAGIAPTGRRIKLTGMTILRIEGGRIAESWTELDMLGLLQEIGAVAALRPVTTEVSAAGR